MQLASRVLSVIVGTAVAVVLAGCSTSGSDAPAPSVTATTTRTVTPTASPSPSPSCGPDDPSAAITRATADLALPDALRDVTSWDAADAQASGYDPCAALSWAIVTVQGGTPSSPYAILLFHDGAYVGTATKEPYPFGPEVSRTDDATLAVTYRYPEEGDANADPTGRTSATLTWADGAVSMTGDVPPTP